MARVETITKFGFVADGKKYRYDEVAVDRASIVPGAEIDIATGAGIELAVKLASVAVAEPVMEVVPDKKVFTPKFQKTESATMSKSEWAAKDRSQLIGGLSHDAAAIVAALVHTTSMTAKEVLGVYKETLLGLLEIRDGLK